jgi:hypothetical protein
MIDLSVSDVDIAGSSAYNDDVAISQLGGSVISARSAETCSLRPLVGLGVVEFSGSEDNAVTQTAGDENASVR